MTGWHAIVPLKSPTRRKTRLGLPEDDRIALTERMAAHVLQTVRETPGIVEIGLLSPESRAGTVWLPDQGRGLNAELGEARRRWLHRAVLIIHADLPHLCTNDVSQLMNAATDGAVAIAPDRHGTGTNALALPPGIEMALAFGPGSFEAHRTAAACARIVQTPGLSHDLDTPDDMAAWSALQQGAFVK
ncbi:2-phospho-L-lactate guanylyltransferase [Sphingobium sp. DEHP117]|uniref:2-phospho-L-lactate guanylyltransferase n=1 Tax=Sphingobium sp. DEHP117 TaxID=2993436 RepID=UPI0027D5AF61|nr:2-phospho-L-lactate guanylyltransferase [Sphingobium sp. DEHP117]MDQ4420349.1 2-phospho-L-lactate guanylyltransferase [Sphingobium sp. DEHP117]